MSYRLYLVSDRNGEVVGFRSSVDANWTATGKRAPALGLPTLGVEFRAMHDKNKTFPVISIELTDEQVKALKLSTKPLPREWVVG